MIKKCDPHWRGVSPEMPPFFDPDCIVCQEKLVAGKVTGDEPMPGVAGKRMARSRFGSSTVQPTAFQRNPCASCGSLGHVGRTCTIITAKRSK